MSRSYEKLLETSSKKRRREPEDNPKNEKRLELLYLRNPQQTYSEMKRKDIEYVDLQGREYIHERSPEFLLQIGAEDIDMSFEKPSEKIATYGPQVFRVRLPIWLKHTVEPPMDGTKIKLMFTKNHIICTGIVSLCSFDEKHKTGYVIIDNFKNIGSITTFELEQFNQITMKSKRIKPDTSPF